MPPTGAVFSATGVAAIGTLVAAYFLLKKPSNARAEKVEERMAAAGIVLPPPGAPKV